MVKPEFGALLAQLRGLESPTSVATRAILARRKISAKYITVLENNGAKEPGADILATLAEMYAGREGWTRDSLFWRLWELAGYPPPSGYLSAADPATAENARRVMAVLARMRPEDQLRWVVEFEATTAVDERTARDQGVPTPMPKNGAS